MARVAGVPYDQYIQENILDPLGMAYTTAQMPVPPELDPYRSVSYTYKDGAFQIYHPDYLAQLGSSTGRRYVKQRHGHGPFHDRAPAGWPLQR